MTVEISVSEKTHKNVPEHIRDAEALTPTVLRNKYKLTYDAWRNMKQRKKIGAIISQEFDKFPDFLRHAGPRTSKDYTLDRINNSDPEYAPGKVHWRDKHTQNKNKGNNIYLTYKGETHTISEWANITNTNPSTLYKRHSNGWSDEEIITGKRSQDAANLFAGTPWPMDKQVAWEQRYQKAVLSRKFKGDRLTFLVKVSRRKYEIAVGHADECDPYNEEEMKAALQEVSKWRSTYENAHRKYEFANNRSRFIKRKTGSLGCVKETALFNHINKEK